MSEKAQVNPEEWVDEYGDQLYRYAYVRLGDKATAEDAVQDCMLGFAKQVHALERPGAALGYLRISVIRRCRYLLKRGRWRRRRLEELAMVERAFEVRDAGRPTVELEEALRLLEDLPVQARDVYILRRVEQMSWEEVSEALRHSVSTCKRRYREAIRLMQELQ